VGDDDGQEIGGEVVATDAAQEVKTVTTRLDQAAAFISSL
jgi:hypothetical protein